ncbi:putative F-box protein At4g09190 [Papaver somniferum]|uniref:putative F-box protein At4g09190 n=1 Tax=Papaver somniferum TaxID=3469 RepID=UPI000E6FB46E|nr:putative F-box protein At4g09190 [Papaver somniferum]XP_026389363.1 putative F-box protein At4g09190 [Papaver somniferum]XP_026389364.1 putative F-box protein At4g09190 [Papaver somniferum]
MHFIHLSGPDSGADKLGFLALTNNDENFHYFEYDENNHDQSTIPPIQRIRRIHFTPPITGVVTFLGSCNGLVCFAKYPIQTHSTVPVCIWNPITKEHVLLPKINTDSDLDQYVYWGGGFGYVSSTNEYKVVGLYRLKTTQFLEVHIYTLGSGHGWRNLGKFSTYYREQGIFADGALYWMSSQLENILTFDLSDEKFCENLSPPPVASVTDWDSNNMIRVLDGFLFSSINLGVEEEEDKCHDIWLIKKKNENHEMKEQEVRQSLGWTKEFRINERKLLTVTKNKGVLTFTDYNVKIYDTKASTSERLLNFEGRIVELLPHKNTLVSLKELGEDDAKIMELVEI